MKKLRWATFALVFVAIGAIPSPAHAADQPVAVVATVDGRAVEGAGSNDPVKLWPMETTEVVLTVTNTSDRDLTIRRARLFGEAFDLTFIAYDAVIDVDLPAGATKEIEIPVEFIDLEKQATGLLPGGFSVYDDNREVVGEQRFVIDVRGSATSALGLFGIFTMVATAAGIVGIVVAVHRRTLGPNRVRRAVRFAFVGLGVGLTLVVGLAVFRVVAPSGTVWIPLTLLPTVAGAALGLVSPGALAIDDEDEDDDIEPEVLEAQEGELVGSGSADG